MLHWLLFLSVASCTLKLQHGLPDITEDVVRECIAVAERFHAGRISKAETFMELYELIPGWSEYEPFIRALDVYVHILNSFKESWHKARNQGETYQVPGEADKSKEVDEGEEEVSS